MLGMEYGSPESLELIKDFQEALHYYTIEGSMLYSKKAGKRLFEEESVYPIEKGEFHWEYFNVATKMNWESLRKSILKYGVANSMFNAQMPTACVSRDTTIKSKDGVISYTDILNANKVDYMHIEKEGIPIWIDLVEPVIVYNEDNEEESCNRIYYNGLRDTLDIEMEDGVIFTCTYNHKFKVKKGEEIVWIEAQNLKEGDDILNY